MIYVREIKPTDLLDHAGIPWTQSLPGLARGGDASRFAWTCCTPVRDETVSAGKSRLFRSIKDECDDRGKKSSLANMVTALNSGLRSDDYQEALKGISGINIKEAFSFQYQSKRHKVWEVKYQNKDRLYFFTLPQSSPQKLFLPLLFHHKNTQTTPSKITEYCEEVMKPFLSQDEQITIIRRKS